MHELSPDPGPDCFSSCYADARKGFLRAIDYLDPSLVRQQQVYEHPLSGPRGETLACDLVQLGRSEQPQQLLVLISATHGVEGFAGSAIQRDSLAPLTRILDRRPELGVILVHALNPWGFAWLRRYDHEGIDLNRNFIDFNATPPANADYEYLHGRLTSRAALSTRQLPLLWDGMDRAGFLEAVTHGQYRHPDGLFFGGRGPAWSRKVVEEITTGPVFATARRIAVIDLHTGLGPYGYGEIINDHPVDSAGFRLVQAWYGDNACSTELGESVSPLKPGLMDFHWHGLLAERGCFVTLEFGTYSAERLILSLFREQQLHNRLAESGAPRDLQHDAIQDLKSFFCPDERSWQQQVLFRARQVMDLALEGMQS